MGRFAWGSALLPRTAEQRPPAAPAPPGPAAVGHEAPAPTPLPAATGAAGTPAAATAAASPQAATPAKSSSTSRLVSSRASASRSPAPGRATAATASDSAAAAGSGPFWAREHTAYILRLSFESGVQFMFEVRCIEGPRLAVGARLRPGGPRQIGKSGNVLIERIFSQQKQRSINTCSHSSSSTSSMGRSAEGVAGRQVVRGQRLPEVRDWQATCPRRTFKALRPAAVPAATPPTAATIGRLCGGDAAMAAALCSEKLLDSCLYAVREPGEQRLMRVPLPGILVPSSAVVSRSNRPAVAAALAAVAAAAAEGRTGASRLTIGARTGA
ncbi:hypothetical protein Emag_006760 [Eimeria magna]